MELAEKIGVKIAQVLSNRLLVECAEKHGISLEYAPETYRKCYAYAVVSSDGSRAVVAVLMRSKEFFQVHTELSSDEAEQYLALLDRGCLRGPRYFADRPEPGRRRTYSFLQEEDEQASRAWSEYAHQSGELLEIAFENAKRAAGLYAKFSGANSINQLHQTMATISGEIAKIISSSPSADGSNVKNKE